MKLSKQFLLITIFIVAACTFEPNLERVNEDSDDMNASRQPIRIPVLFEKNIGQFDEEVKYSSRYSGRIQAYLDDGIIFYFSNKKNKDNLIKLKLIGSKIKPFITGNRKALAKSNYLIGKDSSQWITNIETYHELIYNEVYPGIDLIFYENEGELEFDFVLEPKANYQQIQMKFEGAETTEFLQTGQLKISNGNRSLNLRIPEIFEIDNSGKRITVRGAYEEINNCISFELEKYDHDHSLVIDPKLYYGSFLGGSNDDVIQGIAANDKGEYVVVVKSESVDIPSYPGSSIDPVSDGHIYKFNEEHQLVYSTSVPHTFFWGLDINESGEAAFLGSSISGDYPLVNAFQDTLDSGRLGSYVISILNASGSGFAFSTYFGNRNVYGDVAFDKFGNLFVTGDAPWISLEDFAAVNLPLSDLRNGGVSQDPFLAKFSSSGQLLTYTLFGGGRNDGGREITVNENGEPAVVGWSTSSDFPIKNNFNTIASPTPRVGGFNPAIFLSKFNSEGTSLDYSTFIGTEFDLVTAGIAQVFPVFDLEGNLFCSGNLRANNSGSFILKKALKEVVEGEDDAFIFKLDPSGNLEFSTLFGGDSEDWSEGIATDNAGNVIILGDSYGGQLGIPITNAIEGGRGFGTWITKIRGDGQEILYATFTSVNGNRQHFDYANQKMYITDNGSDGLAFTSNDAFQRARGSDGEDGHILIILDEEQEDKMNDQHGADLLLLKNRWPTPGDQIDSIIFGQFSDTIPSKAFNHDICMSLDLRADDKDINILKKSFAPSDFKKLDPKDHDAIDKETYLSYKLAQLYVDDPIVCPGNNCPEKVNLSSTKNGIYNVIFKSDVANTIIECDKSNNTFPGMRIEIDDFNPGDCLVCPANVTDRQGLTWSLSTDLPDCDNCSSIYPPTSGKAYYDGQSYYASCLYKRSGEDPIALVWLRWQENKLAKDSIVFRNENGSEDFLLHFCRLSEFENEFGESLIPDFNKAMIGNFGHTKFSAGFGKDVLNALVNCYKNRAIDLDSICGATKGTANITPDTLRFNVNQMKEDTIKIFTISRGQVRVDKIDLSGDLQVSYRTNKQLPTILDKKDTLLIFVKLESGQDLNKEKTSELLVSGELGVPNLKVVLGITKPSLLVHVQYAGRDAVDKDTIYAGQSILIGMDLFDRITFDEITDHIDIKIKATTIPEKTSKGIVPFAHEFTISNGQSSDVMYDAFEGRFGDQVAIDNQTILSGKTTIRFEQVGGNELPTQEIDLVYSSPIDFISGVIEYQQGIFLQHLSDSEGGQEFRALPFIANHDGHLNVPIAINNVGLIDYQRLNYDKLKLDVKIFRDNDKISDFTIDDINLIDIDRPEESQINERDYSSVALFRMDNEFDQHIEYRTFNTPGNYRIETQIIYTDNDLIVKSYDRINDQATAYDLPFVATEALNILVYEVKVLERSEYPSINEKDLFDFLRSSYPVEYKKVNFIEGGRFSFPFAVSAGRTRSEIKEKLIQKFKDYNGGNSLKADVVMALGDEKFIIEFLSGSAGMAWERDRFVFCHPFIGQNISHEVGHILGLGDTYKGGALRSVNPRKELVDEGNIVNAFNIHLINENRLNHYSQSRFAEEISIHDFMGRIVDHPVLSRVRHTWVDRVTWDHLYHKYFALGAKPRSQGKYIAVSGNVNKDKSIVLHPLLRTLDPPFTNGNNPLGEYSIVFADEKEQVAFEHRFDIEFYVFDLGPVDEIGFLFYLPYEETYKSLNMTFQDSIIFSYIFSTQPPDITSFGGTFDETSSTFEFTWSASDPDLDQLVYSLSYKDPQGRYWPIEVNIPENEFTWSNINQPWFILNEGSFILTVSDGFNQDSKEIIVQRGTTPTLEETNQKFSMSISPHPVGDYIHLFFNTENKVSLNAEILNINGIIQTRQSLELGRGNSQINLEASDLMDGIYFVRFIDEKTGGVSVLKVLKISN